MGGGGGGGGSLPMNLCFQNSFIELHTVSRKAIRALTALRALPFILFLRTRSQMSQTKNCIDYYNCYKLRLRATKQTDCQPNLDSP